MPTRKKKSTAKPRKPQVVDLDSLVGGGNVPSFYANAIRVMVSMFDFTLMVGQVGYREDGIPEMREALRLNLSPQHAKALSVLLARRVADYEEEMGVIPLPEPTPYSSPSA